MPVAALTELPSDLPLVRRLSTGELLRCLARGLSDVVAAPGPALLHGAGVAGFGWLILALGHSGSWWVPGALSGFVLVGPILATGLYETARLRELGRCPQVSDVLAVWRRGTRPLIRLGLLLAGVALGWMGFSALLFGLFVSVPLTQSQAFIRYVVQGQGDQLFALWTVLGGLGAALVFALTVVSAPLMLERKIGFRRALLTSVCAVGDNPWVMGLWAALIMAATWVGIATAML
ncbi:MAG: DUF2189 domain-containing protein, partial [Burkholderiaceae bacterium]